MTKKISPQMTTIREANEKPQSIIRAAREFTPPTWNRLFEDADEEIAHADEIVRRDSEEHATEYFPYPEKVFYAFYLTLLPMVRVIIWGQDPYYTTRVLTNGNVVPKATGLSFSVDRGDTIPPSLRTIYKELVRSVPGFIEPNHGDLGKWAMQGVLMLNMGLTVRKGRPGTHIQAWRGFISKVIKEVDTVNPHCIHVLWGKEAQKLRKMIPNHAIILESGHPSTMNTSNSQFEGNNHFVKINQILVAEGGRSIDWQI